MPTACLKICAVCGLPESVMPGSVLLGNDLPGSGLPGSGLPGSDLPGSGMPGSGLPRSGLPGSSLPGSGLPARKCQEKYETAFDDSATVQGTFMNYNLTTVAAHLRAAALS